MVRLAVEIGGSKLQAAIGQADGSIDRVERIAADADGGRPAICEQIAALVENIRTGVTVDRMAIGFGGPVDVETGAAIISHQVAGWTGFPLRQWAHDRFNLPCVVENDSNCAGLAEARIGAGKDAPSTFYMNIGSGIGGAFVFDGKLYSTQVGASEIGHTYVWDPSAGRYAILESLCSGWAIQRRARDMVRIGTKSIMGELAGGDPDQIDGPIIGQALAQADPAATDLVRNTCTTLAVALANMIALLNPRCIVIGGGISLMGQPFLDLLGEQLTDRVFRPFQGRQQIIPAALGENVVLAGALML